MELTEREKQIVLALAESDMNKSAAAEMMYMHRNTMTYHLDKIRDKTGLDPRKFYDLVKLLDMARRG